MRPAYLSVSQMNAFLACPAKYRFRYVDQVEPSAKSSALVLGSAVHSTLDWVHQRWQGNLEPSWSDVVRIFEADLAAMASDAIAFKDGEDLEGLRTTGRGLLLAYLMDTPPKRVRGTEVPFEVELVHPGSQETLPVPLRGYLDLIEEDGTVVEIKTAARRYDATTLDLLLQLSAYSYAGVKIFGERPRMRLDCLLKTKDPKLERLEVTRNEADDHRLFVLAEGILQAIQQNSFFPNPSWQCRDCEFRHACPLWSR